MSEVVLGVNAYHGDAAAALLIDGRCVAAAEEERFTRVKHQAGFPDHAIRWCLREAGIEPADVGHVAIGRNPASNVKNKIRWMLLHPPNPRFFRDRYRNATRILDVGDAVADAVGIDRKQASWKVHRVEHHRSHLASAFHCSPFEEAACLSIDGMGDFSSTMWGLGRGRDVSILGSVPHPHSLGHYYTAFSQFMGLPRYGDEYKLMGLAAYGEPTMKDKVREVLWLEKDLSFKLGLKYFVHHTKGVPMTWEGTPVLGSLFSDRITDLLGPPREPGAEISERDANLAASIQAVLEDVGLEMIRRLHDQTKSKRLVMAGGVALNCVLNGRIPVDTPFEEVWVQPASNDAGTSLGAALWAWNQDLQRERTWTMGDVYLGPGFDEADLKEALEDGELHYKREDDETLFPRVAKRIAEGAIVGWYQGRMEFGPRALGNRSIVCDSRNPNMKDILNSRIKHREPFRPFAPSVLAEKTGEWFTQDHPSPYMAMAYEVRPEKRSVVPAITHEDGTGRLQTVERSANERYYELIAAVDKETGVPVVLNTSLNENEPICCTPREAVECFKRTRMDVLVLGNFVVDRTATNE